jgi:response regulator NasT
MFVAADAGMNDTLRIVVVAPDLAITNPDDQHAARLAARSRMLRIGLLENNYNLVAAIPADTFLAERLAQLQPDLIIVDSESEARDALEHVVLATREAPRPIVMFTNDEDTTHVKDAVAAGVCAYIVAGLAPQRIRPILDVAMARFAHEQALRAELADARTELQDRKTIDRAKGLLMQRQGLSEQAAYEKLRKTAMDKGLKLGEVARRMLDMVDLLGCNSNGRLEPLAVLWLVQPALRARHLRTSGADHRDSHGTAETPCGLCLAACLCIPGIATCPAWRARWSLLLRRWRWVAATPLAPCRRPAAARTHKPAAHGLLKEPKMLDLLITHASLPDGRCDMSVAVQGRIVEVAPGLHAPAHETVDAQGQLLSPPFCDPHFHMDATLSYGLPRVNHSGTLLEGIALGANSSRC